MSDLKLLSYIDGQWMAPRTGKTTHDLINPATEEIAATVLVCEADDADIAVRAKTGCPFAQALRSIRDLRRLLRGLRELG